MQSDGSTWDILDKNLLEDIANNKKSDFWQNGPLKNLLNQDAWVWILDRSCQKGIPECLDYLNLKTLKIEKYVENREPRRLIFCVQPI